MQCIKNLVHLLSMYFKLKAHQSGFTVICLMNISSDVKSFVKPIYIFAEKSQYLSFL